MKMNRRNVVAGLGTVVAGGGLALGSGAFSQVEAQRDLEVNVVTGSGIAEEYVDVVIKPGNYGSIGIRNADGTKESDTNNLFPKNGESDYDGNTDFEGTVAGTAVSLIDNDVNIVFGSSDGGDFDDLDAIPANSTVTYDNLFEVINDDNNNSGDIFSVTFEVSGQSTGYDLLFSNPNMDGQSVGAGTTTQVGTTKLTTGEGNDSAGQLTIRID